MRNLLLLSNSTNHGQGYLDHAMAELLGALAGARRILFVPFALADRGGYTAKFRERLAREGVEVDELVADPTGPRRIETAEAVFVGGGNTFRLLRALYDFGFLAALRARALAGMPYLGASAGINVAGPTIRTTNDMPIVEPPSFDALGLVPFQINPHYLDPDPDSKHMGETREQRLREFLEENATPVVALREGAMLRVEGDVVEVRGARGVRLFRRGAAPTEIPPGSLLPPLDVGAEAEPPQ